MAHFDSDSIIVYQAYRPGIGAFAIEHGHFGGDFSYSRMSWIKPNFLWMMYRSGWGTKPGQEVTLGLRLRRPFFEELLLAAVQSTQSPQYASREEWQEAVATSDVRLQWDPDHDPGGAPLERRALQLGMRGPMLEAFGKKELLEVIDLSAFVTEQRDHASAERRSELLMPSEDVYLPSDAARRRVGAAATD
jgi:hypothetical protein